MNDTRIQCASNLQNLRDGLIAIGADAIIVAINNSFGNFESGESYLTQISGYSGSNGRAIITNNEAALCVDGRYTKQANTQTDNSIWKICTYPDVNTVTLISRIMKKGQTLAVGPFSMTYSSYLSILKFAGKIGFVVKLLDRRQFDSLFHISTPSTTKLFLMDEADVGEPHVDRIKRIKGTLRSGEAVLLTEKSIAGWCAGIRLRKATDQKSILPNCVVYISHSERPIVFCDLTLEDVCHDFSFAPLSDFEDVMSAVDKGLVYCDYSTVSVYFPYILQKLGFGVEASKVDVGQFEAVKNQVEISNLRTAAELTSVAFIKALAYVETRERTTEIEVVNVFKAELSKNKTFVDLSFNAISSFGENTSVVHYNPEVLGNADIEAGGLFLFDAGAHFTSATTDMTRVVYRGNSQPPANLINVYTTVLKSVIMFSTARFPDKTKASCLDSIARVLVWRDGFDYNFGTGHGVGSFGNVHERPSISRGSDESITDGMVITVEPGVYMPDFGIRLENMVCTVASAAHQGYVEFETLNFIPFCQKLIDVKSLSLYEVEWLNDYHALVYEKFRNTFADDLDTFRWLEENTKKI
ncbi:MAG: M24 family metallopeptidase [Holosporales bacterium]|jgi:Xaa-Pro aminopeptidase|nr:M24 family metallopeptidase [Holosporales bacterium]